VLSAGRLFVGIGAGWLQEEFEAIGAPNFAERGTVTDEYLQAFRELWTAQEPRFEGRFVKFAGIFFAPKPVQKPHPPIWVGGESGAALRRAARLGDGWYPIGSNPQYRLNTLSRYQAAVDRLRKLTKEAGRDPSSVALAYRVHRHGTLVDAQADNNERQLFSGTNADILEDLRVLRELGVAAVDFNFPGATHEVVVAAMRQFHDEVLARRG
jgi:probable F420-dependent oxidoreductase